MVSLVMGNDNYILVCKLQKTVNDADTMAWELKAARFVVELQKNFNLRSMVRTIKLLTNSISSYDEVVVFLPASVRKKENHIGYLNHA